MSNKFVGSNWEFEVKDNGFIHANGKFWLFVAVSSGSYIGGCAVLAPFFTIGMRKRFRFTQSMLRALPMVGIATKLSAWTVDALNLMPEEDDIKAIKSAIEYAEKILTAVDSEDDHDVFVAKYCDNDVKPEATENERAKEAVQEFKEKIEKIFGRVEEKSKELNNEFNEKLGDILDKYTNHKEEE